MDNIFVGTERDDAVLDLNVENPEEKLAEFMQQMKKDYSDVELSIVDAEDFMSCRVVGLMTDRLEAYLLFISEKISRFNGETAIIISKFIADKKVVVTYRQMINMFVVREHFEEIDDVWEHKINNCRVAVAFPVTDITNDKKTNIITEV